MKTLVIADAYKLVTCEINDGTNSLIITDSVAGYVTRRLNTIRSDTEKDMDAANLYIAFMIFADAAGAAKSAN